MFKAILYNAVAYILLSKLKYASDTFSLISFKQNTFLGVKFAMDYETWAFLWYQIRKVDKNLPSTYFSFSFWIPME